MARPLALARRKPTEWAMRGVLAIVVAGLGYYLVSQALAYAVRVASIERAHSMAPSNGRITALFASSMLQPGADLGDIVRAEAMARVALRQDASAIDAVTTLALIAQGRQDNARARQLFAYSNSLSRRDLRARLGMIEEAVSRGDVPGTLRNYDIALRTSRLSGDILFPVLSSAIADVAVRRQLVPILAKRPPWGDAFISYVTMSGPDIQATAAMLRILHQWHIPMPADATPIIVDRLLAKNQGSAAWAHYATVTSGTDPRRSRDHNFGKAPEVASAFDWRPIQDNGISSLLHRDANGGVFDFSVATSIGGPLLRQTQVLPPGNYILEGRSSGIDQVDSALPYWSLSCLSGREIGRVVVPNSRHNNGRFTGRLTVPADCPTQNLTLVARASDKVGGTNGQIHRIAIHPSRSKAE